MCGCGTGARCGGGIPDVEADLLKICRKGSKTVSLAEEVYSVGPNRWNPGYEQLLSQEALFNWRSVACMTVMCRCVPLCLPGTDVAQSNVAHACRPVSLT